MPSPASTIFNLAWLLGMTGVAVVLFGRRGGGGRVAGALLIALYAVFVVGPARVS